MCCVVLCCLCVLKRPIGGPCLTPLPPWAGGVFFFFFLKVRTPDHLVSEEIPVKVGVLQGDTLAPYLFIMVLDNVLRQLPDVGVLLSDPAPRMTARQKKLHTYTELRLSTLAFADDVLLLSHSSTDLDALAKEKQKPLFSTLLKRLPH